MLLTIFLIIIFLSFLILVHEFGHFAAAKLFGLRVDEFGLGFPPRLWSKKIGETKYSLNWFPIGGFVKILGEELSEEVSEHVPNNPNNIKIIESELSYKLTGLLFRAQEQCGRFAREKQYGDFLEDLFKKEGIKYKREMPVSVGNRISNIVDFFIEDKIVLELKSKPFIDKNDYYQTKRYLESMNLELGLIVNFRDRILKPKRILNSKIRIHSEDSDKFVDSDHKRNFSFQPAWKRLLVIVAGIFMNFLFGWVFLSLVFMIGSQQVLVITDVQEGSPAVLAGLEKNDQILEVTIGGEMLNNPTKTEEFIDFINRFQGQNFTFKINRVGEIKDLTVGSRINPPAGQGSIGIGIFTAGIERQGILGSLKGGFDLTIKASETIFKAVYRLIRGAPEGSEVFQSVVGPIGIFSIASQANALGFVYFLQLVGLISVNLAVINIIPFPALDGGRVFFILLEKIKGSRLRVRTEKLANAIGISVLLALMALITGRDIWRLL